MGSPGVHTISLCPYLFLVRFLGFFSSCLLVCPIPMYWFLFHIIIPIDVLMRDRTTVDMDGKGEQWEGTGRSRWKGNCNQDMLCKGKKIYFQLKGEKRHLVF